MGEEIWVDVKDFEGLYQVSNLGRIKSLCKTVERRGYGKLTFPEKILAPHVDKVGYPRMMFYRKGSIVRQSIHRVVAMSFIPNPEGKPQVNHINSIRTDNRVENLEWCTALENMRHCFKNNRHPAIKGENVVTAKLNDESVRYIRMKVNEGVTKTELAEKFKVSRASIRLVVNRINWAHVI